MQKHLISGAYQPPVVCRVWDDDDSKSLIRYVYLVLENGCCYAGYRKEVDSMLYLWKNHEIA